MSSFLIFRGRTMKLAMKEIEETLNVLTFATSNLTVEYIYAKVLVNFLHQLKTEIIW